MDTLEKFVEQGFTLRTMPAYERHLVVEKYDCAALLEPTPEGRWKRFSSAGHLLEGQIALLIKRGDRKFFVHKSKQLAAEGAPLKAFELFLAELEAILASQ